MGSTLLGRLDFRLQRDEEGHRKYEIDWLIEADDVDLGPFSVLGTAGLASIGSTWAYGGDNDAWAFCTPEADVEQVLKNEPNLHFKVTQKFTTKPGKRCQDDSIENPLDEPADISGDFCRYSAEATEDRQGKALKSSSHERFRGPNVEFDANRPSVVIRVNSITLPLFLITTLQNHLNDAPMWGLDTRQIKLSATPWSRKLYGTCTFYYTMQYEFDCSEEFDRDLIDEGTKCLQGWAPGSSLPQLNPAAMNIITGKLYKDEPKNFEVYKDVNGENTRVLLDGSGRPLADGNDPFKIHVEKYEEGNLLTLPGVPSVLA